VQVAAIHDDGTLGLFAPATPLPAAGWHHTAAAGDHHVAVMGGDWGDGSTGDTVMVNHVNSDGTLGAWRRTSPLNRAMRRWRAEVVGEFIFLVGSETEVAPLR
jgi:hypothetical protein